MFRPACTAIALTITVSASASSQIDAPRVRIVEDLRLDATAEDFPTVGSIYVGPRGQIVVPIRLDQQLRIYDASGKMAAVFGRKGGGPGEFAAIAFVGWKGDSMWVNDIEHRRTTFVGIDYKLLRTEPWPTADLGTSEPGKIGRFDPIALLPNGSWLGQGMLASADGRSYRGVLAILGTDGAYRIGLRMFASENDPRMMTVSGFGRPVPFSLLPQYSFAYNGSRVVELTAPLPANERSHFIVNSFRANGDTAFSRRYEYNGVPISRQARDSALDAILPRGGRVFEGPQDMPQRFQAIARDRMPNWYIPAEAITSGLDQTIWISMRPTTEGRPLLALNGRGDPIGTVLIPRTSRLRHASATQIWVTDTDGDGLTSVVRYRVEGLRCGAMPC